MATKQKVTAISLDPKKYEELKIKSVMAGMPLSRFLGHAGTITTIEQVKAADTQGVSQVK